MKSIKKFIQEKLFIRADNKKYNYHPKNNIELTKIVAQLIKERGKKGNLNDIDTSNVKKMIDVFAWQDFDGDISNWDVSNVTHFTRMFQNSTFTGKNSKLNGWDVSSGRIFTAMFDHSQFNNDISSWNSDYVSSTNEMFRKCPIDNNYKPKFIK